MTDKAIEYGRERLEEVYWRNLNTIFRWFDYLDGFMNAYRPSGRENQYVSIIQPLLEEGFQQFWYEIYTSLTERERKWVRPSWREFMEAYFEALYLTRDVEKAVEYAVRWSGVSMGTARLALSFFSKYIPWLREAYRYADRLYRQRKWFPEVPRRELVEKQHWERREWALRFCIRTCMAKREAEYRQAGIKITPEVRNEILNICREICEAKVE